MFKQTVFVLLFFVSNIAYSIISQEILIHIISKGEPCDFWHLQEELPDIMCIFNIDNKALLAAITNRIEEHNGTSVFFPQFILTLCLGHSPYFLSGIIKGVCENIKGLWGDELEVIINSICVLVDRALDKKKFKKLHNVEFIGFSSQKHMLKELCTAVCLLNNAFKSIVISRRASKKLEQKNHYLSKLDLLVWHLGYHEIYCSLTPQIVIDFVGMCPICNPPHED
jgi:hypothetical protein